jgi:hypothetical protein
MQSRIRVSDKELNNTSTCIQSKLFCVVYSKYEIKRCPMSKTSVGDEIVMYEKIKEIKLV